MDKDKKIKELNKDNEWLRFIETGQTNRPYLKDKIKPRPRVQHVSHKQRRIFQQ